MNTLAYAGSCLLFVLICFGPPAVWVVISQRRRIRHLTKEHR